MTPARRRLSACVRSIASSLPCTFFRYAAPREDSLDMARHGNVAAAMKTRRSLCVVGALLLMVSSTRCIAAPAPAPAPPQQRPLPTDNTVEIPIAELRDKVRGAWAGKMI